MTPHNPTVQDWLTVAEVAAQLRVPHETIRRLIHAGQLRALRLGGTKTGYRISRADLEHLIQQHQAESVARCPAQSKGGPPGPGSVLPAARTPG